VSVALLSGVGWSRILWITFEYGSVLLDMVSNAYTTNDHRWFRAAGKLSEHAVDATSGDKVCAAWHD
jgi:hypothetical protein